jgi:hypothetical protein
MVVDALAASPFALLDKRTSLHFVTDVVHEDDALCLALACRALRDALWARFIPGAVGRPRARGQATTDVGRGAAVTTAGVLVITNDDF